MRRFFLLALLLVSPLFGAKKLEIYFIDVEGGKSVLFVSPAGESFLFDAGWPASNTRAASTDRIIEAAKAAGLKRIDNLVISHFDIDHIGDVPALAEKFPIGHVFDHGDAQTSNPQAKQRFEAYAATRSKVGHTALKAGDKLPIKGLDITVLSSAGKLIGAATKNTGAGKANSQCASFPQAAKLPTDFEDDQSLGLLVKYGKFRMLDLADLEANPTHDLVCPNNLIGSIDLYNVNVHGQFKGIAPELINAINAPVMIQANGARKGADAKSWPVLKAVPGPSDIWQLHTSLNAGKEANPADDFIANLEPTDGFKWIHVSASSDGNFTVSNSRNGFSKKYKARN